MRTIVRTLLAGAVLLSALSALGIHAQSPQGDAKPPAFEVASIKLNESGSQGGGMGFRPGGLFTATNVTVQTLIAVAFRSDSALLLTPQIIGAPVWVAASHYDISARAGDAQPLDALSKRLPAILRSLLEDRFKLQAHTETRELPIYALVKGRSDGSLGPRLRPSVADCLPPARGRADAPPPAVVVPGPSDRPACGIRVGPGSYSAGDTTISNLAISLSSSAGRVVVDRTGLAGKFDVELQWAPDQMPAGQSGPPDPASGTVPLTDGASIFTALQEQLGLKLESTKGPVDVVVIDSVERPTGN